MQISKTDFPEETADHINKINYALRGNIFSELEHADWLIADLSDFRIPTVVLSFENKKKFYLTQGLLNNENLLQLGRMIAKQWNTILIEKVERISPTDLSDAQLSEYIEKYIENLYLIYNKDRIIFIKPKLACQYLNQNTIEYTPNFAITGETNDMIERIYSIAAKYIEFVQPPNNVIGDINCITPFEYHFCQPYYDYMIKTIHYLTSGGKIDFEVEKNRKHCEKEIDLSIDTILCKSLLNRIAKYVDIKNIVLIAKNRIFETLLLEKYATPLFDYIEYNQSTSISKIEERVSALKGNDTLFIVPELFYHEEERSLCSMFYRQKLILDIDFFIFTPQRRIFDKFIGKFSDCFHNNIWVKQGSPIKLDLWCGCACTVMINRQNLPFTLIVRSGSNIVIGDDCNLVHIEVDLWYDSTIRIGSSTSIGSNSQLRLHAFSTMTIGDDCMFSYSQVIFVGDGHPIFVKENGKYKHINPCTECMVEIGNHVWIGHSCKIMRNAKIGDGSIVGMGSLVNKHFPNNVLLVGSPAKIIKKNVSWTRNVWIRELDRNLKDYKNYANETIDE